MTHTKARALNICLRSLLPSLGSYIRWLPLVAALL